MTLFPAIAASCQLLGFVEKCAKVMIKKLFLKLVYFPSLSCSQIWLIPLVDDHHHKIEENSPLFQLQQHQNVSSQQWNFKGKLLLPLPRV
jgi:hypothetical protein